MHIITWHCGTSVSLTCLAIFLFAVNVILKERKSKDSITLAWQGPDRPNGVIVEYEVIYYEKVNIVYFDVLVFHLSSSSPHISCNLLSSISVSHTNKTSLLFTH